MPKCKNCIHAEVCGLRDQLGEYAEQCERFKNADRFVELPCKVGDTVFVVEKIAEEWKIIKDHVENIGIGYFADGVNIYQFDGIKTDGYFEDFGETVFLTREEAEVALKEREKHDPD